LAASSRKSSRVSSGEAWQSGFDVGVGIGVGVKIGLEVEVEIGVGVEIEVEVEVEMEVGVGVGVAWTVELYMLVQQFFLLVVWIGFVRWWLEVVDAMLDVVG
jgi:hypothetical protein